MIYMEIVLSNLGIIINHYKQDPLWTASTMESGKGFIWEGFSWVSNESARHHVSWGAQFTYESNEQRAPGWYRDEILPSI